MSKMTSGSELSGKGGPITTKLGENSPIKARPTATFDVTQQTASGQRMSTLVRTKVAVSSSVPMNTIFISDNQPMSTTLKTPTPPFGGDGANEQTLKKMQNFNAHVYNLKACLLSQGIFGAKLRPLCGRDGEQRKGPDLSGPLESVRRRRLPALLGLIQV